MNVQQYCCGGLNFGYFYDRSPIIVYDGAEQPAYTMADFTPSTIPGCRVPFSKLPDGRPVTDALGPGYTLLRLDSKIDIAPFVQAMRDDGIPIEVVDIEADGSSELYDRKLILVRTDQHVAWRGDALPEQPGHLVDTLTGRERARS